MYRLKLTTLKGSTFLSPFIYPKEVAERRLKSLNWLVKKLRNQEGKILKSGELAMIPVETFPTRSDYNYDRAGNLNFLRNLERRWDELNKTDFNEVEEGSS